MIYCASDLHGVALGDFKKLLSKASFCEDDYLFILGDVIDRGDHGVEILKWLLDRPNVSMLIGNHEAMLLCCGFLFEEITEKSLENLSGDNIRLLTNWLSNGGEKTLSALRELNKTSPQTVKNILEYLKEAPAYETVSAGGRDFLLVHSGLDNFSTEKSLSDYNLDDFIWARPDFDTRYFEDVTTVFGHTPTLLFGPQFKGKIIKTDTWICIDAGVSAGLSPCLLRLDDLAEFYL